MLSYRVYELDKSTLMSGHNLYRTLSCKSSNMCPQVPQGRGTREGEIGPVVKIAIWVTVFDNVNVTTIVLLSKRIHKLSGSNKSTTKLFIATN